MSSILRSIHPSNRSILFASTAVILSQAQSSVPPRRNRPSSDWWNRLVESSNDPSSPRHHQPENRRSHSAVVYRCPPRYEADDTASDNDGGVDSDGIREYMIVSGGFTDEDWTSFPVWAYDLTDAKTVEDYRDDGDFSRYLNEDGASAATSTSSYTGNYRYSQSTPGPWIDLTGLNVGAWPSYIDENAFDESTSAMNDNGIIINDAFGGPRGRVGHLSSIHDDCLYVFGGLTYSLGSFHVENDSGEEESGGASGSGDNKNSGVRDDKNTMIVWKACGLKKLFDGDTQQSMQEDGERIGLKWEKIVPRVDTTIPMPPGSNGLKRDEETNSSDGISPNSAQEKITSSREYIQRPEAATTLSRGEAQGGHYSPTTTHESHKGDCFILYGGMHRHRTSVLENGGNAPSFSNEVPLGDVWKYDYETETLNLLAPYPPLDWQLDPTNIKPFPTARTSHAGTIVGDTLIIHGGMGSYGDERHDNNDNMADPPTTSSFSSSNSYATYRTSPKWIPLSDTWEFDLISLKWKERVQHPQLARSYHSLVGWPDGRVAAFGGFQQDSNIGGETVAFVFKDVIVSRSNETHWLKLLSPYSQIANWHKYPTRRAGIPNRLEHAAVLDRFGSMYVWGGRFQSVRQISGMWRLDLFNADANLQFELAQPDGIDAYEAELQALHMFIATMMFVSLTLSSFFSMMQQRRAREAAEEGNGMPTSSSRRRGGLTRQVIDSLPLKHYEVGEVHNGNVTEESSRLEESECCPICLVDYEEGCEIRSLPCGHDFCRECIDPWLEEHTSCPACRQRVESATSDQPSSSPWYTPSRRNNRYTFNRREQRQSFDQVIEAESTDDSSQGDGDGAQSTTDEWYEQETPPSRSWFSSSIRGYFGRRANGHSAIPNESIELV